VILLHGLNGSKENWVKQTSSLSDKFVKLKDSLLSLGYTIVIPDAKYHGERGSETNFISPSTFYSSQHIALIESLWSTSVKDISIIIDYIQTLPTEQNITFDVVGYSMGGLMAIHLNSIENRISSIVVCVPPLGNSIKNSMRLGLKEENAKKLKVASIQIYAPRQKAQITLLMGTQDGWYTLKEVQDFYDNIHIKRKTLKFYESGHNLPTEFISDVVKALNSK
jgi:dienelactone hydrolase